ncbi:MAG TPA: thiamine diphosphokinase [Acidimicrobiales bacterium]|nr:thiamine diphosphokinase [Acidimicrobiales bacterium]
MVLTGGAAPHPALALPPADLVVAADSGAGLAPALGLDIDLLVGDMDSLSEARQADLAAGGTRIERHPPDKDATDLELALAAALDHQPARIVVVGGDGGRIDHALANLGAIAAAAAPGRVVEAWMGVAHLLMATDEVVVGARVAETVSLVPINGPATGVDTEGLRWPLAGATLRPGTTWGMSNEVAARPARVRVGQGVVAVIRPHALDPAADRRPVVPPRPAGDPAAGGLPPGAEQRGGPA